MNRDLFINEFSKHVLLLRGFESSKPTKKHIDLFDKLLTQLFRRKRYARDQNMWEELYKRSLYFYKHTDRIQGIPAVFVTKHNDIVPWYAKQNIHNMYDTILHFDTHSDLNEVKQGNKLEELYNMYKSTRNETNIIEMNKIVWDIGAAISGTMFTTGIRDYVWCMPSWLPDNNIQLEYFIKGKSDLYLASNAKASTSILIDLKYTKQKSQDDNNIKTYTKAQTGLQSKLDIDLIKNAITMNGKTYILDIDLDYFVCNGKGLDRKQYFKDPYDVESFYRTKQIIFNQDIPRDTMTYSKELSRYERRMLSEVKEISKRIKHFLNLIRKLRNTGLRPSKISICDSTNISYHDCDSCNSVSNGYVPAHLALYVHTKVVDGLQRILQ